MSDADQAMKDAIAQQVANIERQIALIASHAKEASPGSISDTMMKDEITKLRELVAWLKKPSPYGDQSKNTTFYVSAPDPSYVKTASSLENLKANADLAEGVIGLVDNTHRKIERLAAAGKRFNAAKAKQDIHKIASRVQEIVANADLAAPWVKNDLATLMSQATKIHSLFPMDA